MKISVAKDAGYCFGVRDAVNLAYETAHEHGEVYMLGHIVHNEHVVHDLGQAGARVVDTMSAIPSEKPAFSVPTEQRPKYGVKLRRKT